LGEGTGEGEVGGSVAGVGAGSMLEHGSGTADADNDVDDVSMCCLEGGVSLSKLWINTVDAHSYYDSIERSVNS
jgi:hypothetical protein